MKKLLIAMSFLMLVSLTACTAETNTEKELTRAEIQEFLNNVDLEEIRAKNDVREVLKNHQSVLMNYKSVYVAEDYILETEDQYSLHLDENGKIVGASISNVPYLFDIKSDNGFLYASSEHVKSLYVFPLANADENVIASFSFGLEPREVSRKWVIDNELVLETVEKYEMEEDETYYEVKEYHYDIETLLLTETVETTTNFGELVDEVRVTYSYGEIAVIGTAAIGHLTNTTKDTATLTVIDIKEDGSQETRTLDVVIGADLILLDALGEYNYYLDEACTTKAEPYNVFESDLTVYINK